MKVRGKEDNLLDRSTKMKEVGDAFSTQFVKVIDVDASPAGVDLVDDVCEEEEIIYEVDAYVAVTSLWTISRSIFSSVEARLNVLLNRRIRNIWISTIPELCNRTTTTPVIDVHGKCSMVGPHNMDRTVICGLGRHTYLYIVFSSKLISLFLSSIKNICDTYQLLYTCISSTIFIVSLSFLQYYTCFECRK